MCEITLLLHDSYENDTRLYSSYCDWWEKCMLVYFASYCLIVDNNGHRWKDV